MITDFETLLQLLSDGGVEFCIVGGVAARAHGSARLTQDLDVVYARTADNIERLVSVLGPYEPYLRGAPPGLPFTLDALTVRAGLNFTLTTTLGDLDLLGQITGGGSYEDLSEHTVVLELFQRNIRCIDLDTLIVVKRAAGRPKDLEAIAELMALRDESKA